jgi:hypothetical protein
MVEFAARARCFSLIPNLNSQPLNQGATDFPNENRHTNQRTANRIFYILPKPKHQNEYNITSKTRTPIASKYQAVRSWLDGATHLG